MFAILGVESIHTMNAYKTLMATICNGVALVPFFVAHAVYFPQALLMLIGASLGGYYGAYFAQKMNPQHVRWMVIAIGACMTFTSSPSKASSDLHFDLEVPAIPLRAKLYAPSVMHPDLSHLLELQQVDK
jgi:hypothetical protein